MGDKLKEFIRDALKLLWRLMVEQHLTEFLSICLPSVYTLLHTNASTNWAHWYTLGAQSQIIGIKFSLYRFGSLIWMRSTVCGGPSVREFAAKRVCYHAHKRTLAHMHHADLLTESRSVHTHTHTHTHKHTHMCMCVYAWPDKLLQPFIYPPMCPVSLLVSLSLSLLFLLHR